MAADDRSIFTPSEHRLDEAELPEAALERIDTYMKRGGTVLFDTRDAVDAPPGPGGDMQGPGMVALRTILSSLDIPELEPVPRIEELFSDKS